MTSAELGGAQISTFRLLRELEKKSQHQLYLAYGEKGPLLSCFSELKKTTVIRLKYLQRRFHPLFDLICLFQLYFLFLEYRFDLLHTHCSKPSILGRLAAVLAGIKHIFHTYHGFGHPYFRNFLFRICFVFFEKWLNRWNQGTVFVCQSNLDEALKMNLVSPEQRHVVIQDMHDFYTSIPKSDKSGIHLLIGSVLSFKEQKRPLELILLAHRISRHVPEAEFVFIGTGPLLEKTQAFAHKIGLKKVIFPGAVQNTEPYYSRMNLFLSCSRYEGLSMAQIECLYYHVPIVTTPAGGISDMLEQGKQGFIYPYLDIKQAVTYSLEILKGPFYYVPKSVSFFDPFDHSRIIEKHEKLYAS